MKKITAFLLMVIMLLSAVTANAQTPTFLSDIYPNYTGDYSLSLSFESSDDIMALFDEMEIPEEINNFIDLKALLKTLLSFDSQMKLQLDMSEDFRKFKYALTAESSHIIDVNKNLNIGINAKTGMWMNVDLTTEQPVFELIYSYPYMNKYMTLNLFDMVSDDNEKLKMITAMRLVFSKDFFLPLQNFYSELLRKHADITMSGSKCIVKIDNEALIAMIDETLTFISEKMDIVKNIAEVYDMSDEVMLDFEFPSFAGLQLLGDEGITYTYSLVSGRVTAINEVGDISIDISKIFTHFSGEEWEYDAKGLLDFRFTSSAKLSRLGSTKVEFPALTEENSISFTELMPQPENEEDYTYEPTYPNFYTYSYVDRLPMIGDEIYVPLRETIVSAYDDTADIQYDNGVITINCEHFPEFATLKLKVNSDVAYTDDTPHTISKVLVYDDISYVSSTLFKDIFGWELSYVNHEILENMYSYSFDTMTF